uniref:Uncharacterized protein n=1 Tax=Aegilops tauschii subsp. strangulata TaxID=200361 RepID=A0A453LLF9_AEGTS
TLADWTLVSGWSSNPSSASVICHIPIFHLRALHPPCSKQLIKSDVLSFGKEQRRFREVIAWSVGSSLPPEIPRRSRFARSTGDELSP